MPLPLTAAISFGRISLRAKNLLLPRLQGILPCAFVDFDIGTRDSPS
jgi:hypothetical protein